LLYTIDPDFCQRIGLHKRAYDQVYILYLKPAGHMLKRTFD